MELVVKTMENENYGFSYGSWNFVALFKARPI